MKQCDIAIVGAGPAGYVAAISAARLDQKVILIEKDLIGGTCLNRGCIPTKTLLHASSILKQQEVLQHMGVKIESMQVDIKQMNQYKNEIVSDLRKGIDALIKANKIELIQGEAKLVKEHELIVNEEVIEAKTILLATGSSVAQLKIPGIEYALTSDDVLSLDHFDLKRVIIIGGGVIGVEFATFFNNLGCDVTLLEAQEKPLMLADKEIIQNLMMNMKKHKIECLCQANVKEIRKEGHYEVDYIMKEQLETIQGDVVVVAVGRKANLIESNVDLWINQGRYQVNEYFQTNVEHIYAVGDASSSIQLAHLASAQGHNAIFHSLEKSDFMDVLTVPSCIYTNPEIAWVGLNEKEAIKAGRSVKVGKYNMLSNAKSRLEQQERGFVKIVCDESSEEVLGACMMCAHATDMISLFTVVISNHMSLRQCLPLIFPHPTFSEGIHEAFQDVLKSSIHTIYRN